MCFAAKPHWTQVTFSDAQNGSELYFPMGPTKSIYSFCKKNISEINLKLAQSIYSLIYEMDITECTKVYWICLFISWISHPRLCFIAFKMKFNYPVPSHFQFSGRDGSGTWKKVGDGSGTGIPSDPGRMAKIGLLGRKPSFWARKSVDFLMDTMIWSRTGKVVQRKNFLFPK